MRKTSAMAAVELADAQARRGPVRDIREILAELYQEEGTLAGVAVRLDVDRSTVSQWVTLYLGGRIQRHGATSRLVFEGWKA